MFYVLSGVLTRIVSNSCINVFQKLLAKENKSSVVNFYTYLGLSCFSLLLIPFLKISYSPILAFNVIIMGLLGALGNYFIIKALSIGELSSLAPVNSYKPIVSMVFAFIFLGELPTFQALIGILFIIAGTYFLYNEFNCNKKALYFRILALIFSGTEAVFIKKIILLSNVPTSFMLWAFSGLLFSFLFLRAAKFNFKIYSLKNLIFLIISAAIMQLSTNYVFSKMNVSYALALFQLSAILSVFLGINIFHEKDLLRKIIASTVMVFGAVIIILG